MTTEKLYTPEEIATLLQLNIMTIYRYIKQGKLKATRLANGSQYRITESNYNVFINTPSITEQ